MFSRPQLLETHEEEARASLHALTERLRAADDERGVFARFVSLHVLSLHFLLKNMGSACTKLIAMPGTYLQAFCLLRARGWRTTSVLLSWPGTTKRITLRSC